MKSSTPSKNPVTDDTLSPTLVDPSLVTVMGVVDGQSPAGPSDLSDKPVEKRKKERRGEEGQESHYLQKAGQVGQVISPTSC